MLALLYLVLNVFCDFWYQQNERPSIDWIYSTIYFSQRKNTNVHVEETKFSIIYNKGVVLLVKTNKNREQPARKIDISTRVERFYYYSTHDFFYRHYKINTKKSHCQATDDICLNSAVRKRIRPLPLFSFK